MSLKAKIRNIAKQKNIPAQVILQNYMSVSYTHLDVYKRQLFAFEVFSHNVLLSCQGKEHTTTR